MKPNRHQRRAALSHDAKLESLLKHFFKFLSKQPQPSNEQVRIEFCKSELAWKQYCTQHRLGIRQSMLFNAKVAYEWERHHVQRNNSTENKTPKQ